MEPDPAADLEVMQRPERLVRSGLHSPDDPPFFVFLAFSFIHVCYVGLCVLWVLCASSKATPPSVMVLLLIGPLKPRHENLRNL